MKGNPYHDENGRFCSSNRQLDGLEEQFSHDMYNEIKSGIWSIKREGRDYVVYKNGEEAFVYERTNNIRNCDDKYKKEAERFLQKRDESHNKAIELMESKEKNGEFCLTEDEFNFLMNNLCIEDEPPSILNEEKKNYVETRTEYWLDNIDEIADGHDIPMCGGESVEFWGEPCNLPEYYDGDSEEAIALAKERAEDDWFDIQKITLDVFDQEYGTTVFPDYCIVD